MRELTWPAVLRFAVSLVPSFVLWKEALGSIRTAHFGTESCGIGRARSLACGAWRSRCRESGGGMRGLEQRFVDHGLPHVRRDGADSGLDAGGVAGLDHRHARLAHGGDGSANQLARVLTRPEARPF